MLPRGIDPGFTPLFALFCRYLVLLYVSELWRWASVCEEGKGGGFCNMYVFLAGVLSWTQPAGLGGFSCDMDGWMDWMDWILEKEQWVYKSGIWEGGIVSFVNQRDGWMGRRVEESRDR